MSRTFKYFNTALLLCLLAGIPLARGSGYNQQDPPNMISFDRVNHRVVKAPALKIPESCDASYRAGMESAFRQIWGECQLIGKTEPSDCQRALFNRCTRLANELQAMEVVACTEMHGERDALNRILDPSNQKNSQVSASDLNQRAAMASRRVASALERSARNLATHKKNAMNLIKANVCSFSSSAAEYKRTEARLIAELSKNEKFVTEQAVAKKAAADKFQRNSGQSASSASMMRSAVVVDPAAVDSSTAPLSTYTVTENLPTITQNTATIITTSTELTTTVTTRVVKVQPKPSVPYPVIASSKERVPRWVPILAVALPAAILGGILISKRRGSDSSDSPSSLPDSGSADTDLSGSPSPSSGGQANADPVPGNMNLRDLGMQVDSSFTDRERATIAASVERIPSCMRYKLKGLEVRRANLSTSSAERGKCVAGSFILGGNTVRLDPKCAGIQVGISVHEFFHVIGNREANALHLRYREQVEASHPRCPVSPYGGTNFYEDFAEAGRLTTVSSNDRNRGSCVDAKLAGMRQILASCQ